MIWKQTNINKHRKNFNLTFHKNFSEMVVDCKSTLDEHIKGYDNLIIKDNNHDSL